MTLLARFTLAAGVLSLLTIAAAASCDPAPREAFVSTCERLRCWEAWREDCVRIYQRMRVERAEAFCPARAPGAKDCAGLNTRTFCR